jgi:3'-5' exonuclease
MLSGEICALDHSHKVNLSIPTHLAVLYFLTLSKITKEIMKVHGQSIWVGLLTVTNQKAEVRVCDLAATKSHSQFELALKGMKESLKLYGHLPPKIFYTDNIWGDKQFLEESFESLRQNVIPVEKYSHLKALEILDDIQVVPKNNAAGIADVARIIIDSLPDDNNAVTTIGFDSERNVTFHLAPSDKGKGKEQANTAVVTIGHNKHIYILQIGELMQAGKLPVEFVHMLADGRVKKVSHMVNADLIYLQKEMASEKQFKGATDLAKLAKECHLVSDARCSLQDLCAVVLKKRLDKNTPERISNRWENETLTPRQIDYAARDVYAAMLINEHLLAIPAPGPLPENPAPGTAIIVYQTDHTLLIAKGVISEHAHEASFDGINITSKRTVVEIQEVLVPGAIMTTHNKKVLQDFGLPPFSVVCLKSHLQTASSMLIDHDHPNTSDELFEKSQSSSTLIMPYPPADDTEQETSMAVGALISDDFDVEPDSQCKLSEASKGDIDDESNALGMEIIGEMPSNYPLIRSRVLKDPFHVFNMIYIPKGHGLLYNFAHALRDAIFIPDKEDKDRISAYAASLDPPQTWAVFLRYCASFLWKHCKRVIPPPELLYPMVAKVFQAYRPLKDGKTGQPLFNKSAWKSAKNILALVQNGYLSDPPGIALYYQIGLDSKHNGLPIYRCMCGTNMTEGGVHKQICSHVPVSGVSLRHMYACLLDFILRHNLLVRL